MALPIIQAVHQFFDLDDPRQFLKAYSTIWLYQINNLPPSLPHLPHLPLTDEAFYCSFHSHLVYHAYSVNDKSRSVTGLFKSCEGMNEPQASALVSSLWNGDIPAVTRTHDPEHSIKSIKSLEYVEHGTFTP
jgi:hypothetical protein